MAYERIIRRIAFIEHQLNLFQKWLPKTQEEFSENLLLQAAMAHQIQIIVQAIIQICVQLVKFFELGPPASEEEILSLLKPKLQNYDLIFELKKLRNFVLHQYIKVDTIKLFKYFDSFQHDIHHIISEFRDILS